jgi:cellulose synthase/poly-beta-1,6-N-acetylglucosamine synthase-like glycosyltransferase
MLFANHMLLSILHILFLLIFIYLFLSILYLLLIAIGGLFWRPRVYGAAQQKKRIAILIPSYKEDNIIVDTATRASQTDYPFFEVFVIADRLQPETVESLQSIPVNVVPVSFEIGMKSKSLNAALDGIAENRFDLVLILDADNLMSPNCLEKVNSAFQQGFKAVQCHRVAKNKNNAVALLDAISEEINNNLFRRGQRAFGLSASLIGSGMAFEFEKIRAVFSDEYILTNPGEDREIELQLIKAGILVEYIQDAFIYDEKVSSAAVFEKQRTRWLEAQFTNIKRMFDQDVKTISHKLAYWNKLFQVMLLPRSLYLLLLVVMTLLFLLSWLLNFPLFYPAPAIWLTLAIAYMLSLAISVPRSYYNYSTLKAVARVPVLMLAMLRAMLRMKANRKEFLHTPKVHTGDQ